VYFNNDHGGAAVRNARTLARMAAKRDLRVAGRTSEPHSPARYRR
jgi:hypothetical protein